MIAVDTSAVVAVLFEEAEFEHFVTIMEESSERVMSVASLLELTMVLSTRQPAAPPDIADRLLSRLRITVVDLTEYQVRFAREAFLRFGKGRHPAGLNYGDCFSYGLARSLDVPLLFKGDDFRRTDILVAGYPANPPPGALA